MKKIDYYRPANAADYAGVSRPAVYAAIRRGHITPVETLCGLKLISQKELDLWIAGAEDRKGLGGRPPKDPKE